MKKLLFILLISTNLFGQYRTFNLNRGKVQISWQDKDITGKKYQHPGIIFNLYQLDLNKNLISSQTTQDTSIVLSMQESGYFYLRAENDAGLSEASDTILVNVSEIPANSIQVPFSLSGAELLPLITFKGVVVKTQDTKMGIWGHVQETTVSIPIYIPVGGDYVFSLSGSGEVSLIIQDEISILTLNNDLHRIEKEMLKGAYIIKLHTINQFILNNLEVKLKAGGVPGTPVFINAENVE